jgi:hypothetical protein
MLIHKTKENHLLKDTFRFNLNNSSLWIMNELDVKVQQQQIVQCIQPFEALVL